MRPTKGGGTKKGRPARSERRSMLASPKRALVNAGQPEAGAPVPPPFVPRPHVQKFGKLLYYSSPPP